MKNFNFPYLSFLLIPPLWDNNIIKKGLKLRIYVNIDFETNNNNNNNKPLFEAGIGVWMLDGGMSWPPTIKTDVRVKYDREL